MLYQQDMCRNQPFIFVWKIVVNVCDGTHDLMRISVDSIWVMAEGVGTLRTQQTVTIIGYREQATSCLL